MNTNNRALPMTEEIRTSFRDAKNKREQLLILSQLNACKIATIVDIIGDAARFYATPKKEAYAEFTKKVNSGATIEELAEYYCMTKQQVSNQKSYLTKIGLLKKPGKQALEKAPEPGEHNVPGTEWEPEIANDTDNIALQNILHINEMPDERDLALEIDAVNAPPHYCFGNIETIDYIADKLTAEEFTGFCIGNALKYLSRWRHKGGVEDLKKARVYLGWAIDGRHK